MKVQLTKQDQEFLAQVILNGMKRLKKKALNREKKRAVRASTLEDLAEEVYYEQIRRKATITLLEAEFVTHRPSEVSDMIVKRLQALSDDGSIIQFDVEPQIDEGNENTYPILRVACVSSISFDFEVFLQERAPYYGWYVGFAKKQLLPLHDRSIVLYQEYLVEPRLPSTNADVQRNTASVIAGTPMFYHVTRDKFAPKIERLGLIPSKTKREELSNPSQDLMRFDYPERIYLFTDFNAATEYAARNLTPRRQNGYLEQTKEINKRYIGNQSIDQKHKVEAAAQYQTPNAGMVYFSVDLKQLQTDGRPMHLYHDNRFGAPGTAYFTTDPIPPKYLKRGGSMGIPPNLV